MQIVANAATMDILSIYISKGKTHDFKLFKDSKLHFSSKTEVLADKGYLGISALHPNSTIPVKESKNHKLSATEKAFNSALSKRRIYIEHINRYIKRFRILSSRYRNKRRRFALRASLICGIYNFQH